MPTDIERSTDPSPDLVRTSPLDDLLGKPLDEADGPEDDLFDDDLSSTPARMSRVTIALLVLLVLAVGFLAGVQVQKLAGGISRPVASQSAAASPSSGTGG